MQTQEISREEWRTFCDRFSRQYQGGTVTLEEIDSNSGAHMITWDLALEGIVADLKHSSHETLAIVVSEGTDRHVTHLISAPLQIQLQQAEPGAGNILHIRSANGVTTLLRFGLSKKLSDNLLEALLTARMTSNYYEQKEVLYAQV